MWVLKYHIMKSAYISDLNEALRLATQTQATQENL